MKPMGIGEDDDLEIRKSVLGDLQKDMAKRRVLNIVVDLDKGTVETEGTPEHEAAESPSEESDEMDEPEDVKGRLKSLLG